MKKIALCSMLLLSLPLHPSDSPLAKLSHDDVIPGSLTPPDSGNPADSGNSDIDFPTCYPSPESVDTYSQTTEGDEVSSQDEYLFSQYGEENYDDENYGDEEEKER